MSSGMPIDIDKSESTRLGISRSSIAPSKLFTLPGVYDGQIRETALLRPLPNASFALCHIITRIMQIEQVPTASAELVQEDLYGFKGTKVLEQAGVLTFAEYVEQARRQGLPIRCNQAWGAPHRMWVFFSIELEELGKWALQIIEMAMKDPSATSKFVLKPEMPSFQAFKDFAPLLAAMRKCLANRPTTTLKKLYVCLLTQHGRDVRVGLIKEMQDLTAYIDEAILQGIPIRREDCKSEKAQEELHVWFHCSSAMFSLLRRATLIAVKRCRTEYTPKDEQNDKPLMRLHAPHPISTLLLHRYKEAKDEYLIEHNAKIESINANFYKKEEEINRILQHQRQENNKLLLLKHTMTPSAFADEKKGTFFERIGRQFTGKYTSDIVSIRLVALLIRIIAERHSWYINQKRLYVDTVLRKLQLWAPDLLHLFGYNFEALFMHAKKQGTPIGWSPGAKRLNVGRMLSPIINDLRPNRQVFKHARAAQKIEKFL